MKSRQLSILGSTGSIGQNTLKIVDRFPERFAVRALSAKSQMTLLAEQVRKYHPEMVAVGDEKGAETLAGLLPHNFGIDIVVGEPGLCKAAAFQGVDMVVTAVVGAVGLHPTLAAIEAGKDIALANKETLVMAGQVVMTRAKEKGIHILPVDSEHSAIFQCLAGNQSEDIDRILLTGSGGPFRATSKELFEVVTVEAALKHPNWDMGKKITIDSATMMNKGLEVIEARWLFDVPLETIDVVVHPQSIVHSMVAYKDGSVLAQMGVPDMRGAIAYALSWPHRLDIGLPAPDFPGLHQLNFEPPDLEKFACLRLAMEACGVAGTMPAVLNAANEVAVYAFLDGKIGFTDIPRLLESAMEEHNLDEKPTLEAIIAADAWARRMAEQMVIEGL